MEGADGDGDPVPAALDTLRIYGFSFDFPITDRLEFNPKFRRQEGDVAIKSPANSVVFVSWGPLEKISKKAADIEGHAEFSIERVRKSVQGRLTTLERREVKTNGHSGVYNHVRVDVPRKSIFGGRAEQQEIRSLHVHCEESSRYFVIYATSGPANASAQEETMRLVMESFRCHGGGPSPAAAAAAADQGESIAQQTSA